MPYTTETMPRKMTATKRRSPKPASKKVSTAKGKKSATKKSTAKKRATAKKKPVRLISAKKEGPLPKAKSAAAKSTNSFNSRRVFPKKPATPSSNQPSMGIADDPLAADILKKIREALSPSTLSIKNLTRLHAQHKGAKEHGGGHYSIYVVSDLFTGLKPIQRQQWVYSLLEEALTQKLIHALEMRLHDSNEVSTLG